MATARQPQKQPQMLPLHYLIISVIGLPIFLVLFIVGLVGMAVILDEEKTSALSQSAFGVIYWGLIQRNPYISAITVNGGGLGVLVFGANLVGHYKAKKQQKAAASSEAVAKETKKSK